MAEIGTSVWVRCQRRAWTAGVVEQRSEEGDKTVFTVRKEPVDDDSNDSHDGFDDGYDAEDEFVKITVKNGQVSEDMFLCNVFEDGKTLADVEDLTWLTHLNEPSILQALSDRFDKDLIYTNTGPILLAVNPFKQIKLYTKDMLELYYSTGLLKSQGLEAPGLAPHVYATGDNAYRSLVDTSDSSAKNQSILISGESGAGKTESTKFVMQYLATVAKDDKNKDGQKIADMVLQSNPILEAFGNARTNRNDNSSRFGKFIEMQFNASGMLVGARIVTYLLEKVRLAKQGIGERNFHVFYQLVRGASDAQIEQWKVPMLEDCGYTNQSECFDRQDGVEDDDQFQRMWKAMETMGFPDEEKEQLMCAVSAVMNLANLSFEAAGDGSGLADYCKPSLEACSELLKVDQDKLCKALTFRKISAGNEIFDKPLNPVEAADARDALAKTIYSRMFDHVVLRINESIQVSSRVKTNFIGVLDIFGFEVFQSNSFEQLCINYANETLQQQFNQFVFKLEQREYEKEKIRWSFIDFPDNQKCLDLIEAKPIGILSLLDEQCLFPQGNDKSLAGRFYEKLDGIDRFSVSSKEKATFQFTVGHYAGNVTYDTDGFVAKNKDQLYQEALDLLEASEDVLIRTLFPKAKAVAVDPKASGKSRSVQSKTVGSQFKDQLSTLLKTIRSTSPHYIRCLKPNDMAKPGLVSRNRLVEQLRYGGVLEAVKVARAGYPVRLVLSDFVTRYFMLGGAGGKVLDVVKARTEKDGRPACEAIVERVGLEKESEYQVGRTKLFLRKGAYEKIEAVRLAKVRSSAVKIQAVARARQDLKHYGTLMRSVRKLQAAIRGMLGRSKARHLRQTNAAVKIQVQARSYLAKAYVQKAYRSIVIIQSTYRGYKAGMLAKNLKKDRAVLSIQSWWRGLPLRTAFLRQRKAIVIVQTCARGSLARMMRKRLREEARQVGNLQTKINDLQNRVKELEQELEEEKQAHQALKDSVAAGAGVAAAAAITAASAASTAGVDVETLRQELEEKSRALHEAQQRVEEQQNELEALKVSQADKPEMAMSEAPEMPADNLALEEQLAAKQAELDSANALIAELQAAKKDELANGGEVLIPEENAEKSNARVVELETKLEQMEKELEEERSKSSKSALAAGAVGATAGVAVGAVAGAVNSASSSSSIPQAPPSPARELAAESSDLDELRNLVDQLSNENEELNNRLAAAGFAEGGMAAATSATGDLAKKVKDLEQENEALIEQHSSLVERLCDAENRAMETQEEIHNLKKDRKDLKDKLESMERMYEQGSGVKIALARRLETLILENRTLREEMTEMRDTLDRIQEENRILRQ